ncbi:biliverdin-producing heme oxygenase [Paracraurococcus lichenis]|uniref:Biliverdin-producing heme oxygenase n=1 Tax=Paracraurococcus lichenis TaxID=3064888 RepID=A0ABT9E1B1_9PROT|nr:biliverdin-producing heme oxygenase [Paracraurococcus sp. LOR1-02]MDO9709956.1 biliverdin-producing heme oxygenase [Paracraurococcus sp. LOR1-02]
MSAAAAATARDALRAATDAIHARLHGLPALQALAEGRIGRAGYVALLRRLLGFHAAVEAALADAPSLGPSLIPWGIDIAQRRRAGLIEADLATLGAALGASAGPVPLAPLPALGTVPRALGCLYVTEGSTLGGRQLARALDGLLPPGEAGRRFLLGHGARHGAMWRACCAALEHCGAEPARRAEMLAAAEATFLAFEAWFAGAP